MGKTDGAGSLAAAVMGFASGETAQDPYKRLGNQALFDASGSGAHAAFRLTGEQIAVRFQLSGETYLLEAKWTDLKIVVL